MALLASAVSPTLAQSAPADTRKLHNEFKDIAECRRAMLTAVAEGMRALHEGLAAGELREPLQASARIGNVAEPMISTEVGTASGWRKNVLQCDGAQSFFVNSLVPERSVVEDTVKLPEGLTMRRDSSEVLADTGACISRLLRLPSDISDAGGLGGKVVDRERRVSLFHRELAALDVLSMSDGSKVYWTSRCDGKTRKSRAFS